MKVPALHLSLLLVALVFCGGCQRHPLDATIRARAADLDFSLWLSKQAGTLTADDLRDLQEALTQIKFSVMTASPGLPTKEFSHEVYRAVNGVTAREILLRSVELQSERIDAEIKALEIRDERYRQMNPTSLTNAKREFIEAFNARMASRRAELQRLEDRKTLLLAR